MKVFENMDREQAAMYRWMRRNMNWPFFTLLTGVVGARGYSELEIDKMLREACDAERAKLEPKLIGERSLIRSGVLPSELGAALKDYTETVRQVTLMETIPGEMSPESADRAMKEALLLLCNEMAKLRKL